MRLIRGYNMSKEKLLSVLSESELAKSLDNAKIKKIMKDFNKLREVFKAKNKRDQKKSL